MKKRDKASQGANPHLSEDDLRFFKRKLLDEKTRVLSKEVGQSHFHLDKNELSDPVDEASANHIAETENRFRNRENFYLKKIDKALEKLERNEYGICIECGSSITMERLDARPTAELCIDCKEEQESVENSNIHGKRSKSLGKTINEIGRL